LFDGATPPRSGPLRLAIISTYDEMCGIAGYTRALEQQLRPHADVTVFDLDQYLLRSPHKRVQRLADNHIKEIATRLREFDSVNIQLEYGTLGRTTKQIMRRFRKLVTAAPAVSVTFHTILGQESPDWSAIGWSLITGRIFRAFRSISSFQRNRELGARTYRFLRVRQRVQPVNVIVHTKRDARLLRDVFRIRNVDHHPLSFITAADAERIRQTAARDQFPLLRTFPPNAKLIGSFGFLSPYKGFETALRALHYLPEDHHLLIFGGVHPQAIKREQVIDPYIQTLLDEAHIGQTILDTASEKGMPLSFNLDAASKDMLTRHPEDLHRRVHFLGVHNDEAFMRAMALCDMVVLPYLEVGQSSSGPIAMALEMGCRVLASRTLAFLQFARYHPNQIEFFDIGNYAELADLILAHTAAPGADRRLDFHTGTNTALYLEANQPRSRKLSRRRDKILQPSNAIVESVS
jgi:glycosyltransferase involved in cell wall biosynthesis